jgi:serine/threonine-protein kinase
MSELSANAPSPGAAGADHTGSHEAFSPVRFGKYTLLRRLAKGGMAELYLALQRSVADFEKLVVIKRILPQMNQDQAFIDMLLHEARVAATMTHPNIVQIYDVGQVDGLYYIAMEHAHGEDIRSIVRQMKKKGVAYFPFEHALGIAIGICAGLAYAHERRNLDGTPLRIVHRDISPQNVIMTYEGDVKVVDFGIAKSNAQNEAGTKSGRLKGKVPYMSPEQARGEEVDHRSDIFSTGVLLFELTTGRRLFRGASEYDTLKMICESEYPLPTQLNPEYPRALEHIVMRALAKNRDQRYSSAREMQADLEAFVHDSRLVVSEMQRGEFMSDLFAEKLERQKEMLQTGKALADILAIEAGPYDTNPPPSMVTYPSHPGMSGPQPIVPTSRFRAELVAIPLLLALGGGGFFAYQKYTAVQTAASRGALSVTTDPPGAAIWIDGDLRESTPATLDGLPRGKTFELKVSKDGFESHREKITLDASGTATKAVTYTLSPGQLTVEVAVEPAEAATGASLVVDGKPFEGLRASKLASGESHAIEVKSVGWVSQKIAAQGGAFETKKVTVTLEREKASNVNALPNVGKLPLGVPSASAKTTASASVVAPPPAAGKGKLNVGATGGWCNVAVDGAAKGATPVAGIELSSGNHTVTCTTSEGKSLSAAVNVPVDGVARYKFSL